MRVSDTSFLEYQSLINSIKEVMGHAELLKRKGDLSEAKEDLNTAIEILKECGADGWVKKYQEALARM